MKRDVRRHPRQPSAQEDSVWDLAEQHLHPVVIALPDRIGQTELIKVPIADCVRFPAKFTMLPPSGQDPK